MLLAFVWVRNRSLVLFLLLFIYVILLGRKKFGLLWEMVGNANFGNGLIIKTKIYFYFIFCVCFKAKLALGLEAYINDRFAETTY